MEDMDRLLMEKNEDKQCNEEWDKEAGDVQRPLSLKGRGGGVWESHARLHFIF